MPVKDLYVDLDGIVARVVVYQVVTGFTLGLTFGNHEISLCDLHGRLVLVGTQGLNLSQNCLSQGH